VSCIVLYISSKQDIHSPFNKKKKEKDISILLILFYLVVVYRGSLKDVDVLHVYVLLLF